MSFTSASSSITAAVSPSSTSSPGNNTNNNNNMAANQSNPLLFFVALGFGVVFTNLWIIVGVKYCFRYNARNRARLAGHDDVDMQGLARPHRRRREKKLMTMDEVNERFPATKYKTWRATREVMGLPTAGGMAAPESRPATARQSMEAAERHEPVNFSTPTIPEPVAKLESRQSVSDESVPRQSMASARHANTTNDVDGSASLNPTDTRETAEEDEAVAAVPEDLANTSGDTCAICIDNLEDVDDIRGLTCGHAFHTGCLDPWLTSRRACCPLCKHDYYVPKPRSETEIAAEEAARERRRLAHEQMMARPGRLWLFRVQNFMAPIVGEQSSSRTARQRQAARRQAEGGSRRGFHPFRRNAPTTTNTNSPDVGTGTVAADGNRSIFGRFRRDNANIQMNQVGTNPTPSDLEAGMNAPATSISSPDPVHRS